MQHLNRRIAVKSVLADALRCPTEVALSLPSSALIRDGIRQVSVALWWART